MFPVQSKTSIRLTKPSFNNKNGKYMKTVKHFGLNRQARSSKEWVGEHDRQSHFQYLIPKQGIQEA
jgi:hypothetical protein